jgi:hypothetical protein
MGECSQSDGKIVAASAYSGHAGQTQAGDFKAVQQSHRRLWILTLEEIQNLNHVESGTRREFDVHGDVLV